MFECVVHEMSAKSAVAVADSDSTIKLAIYGKFRKTKSDTILYYHVRNLHRAPFFGIHEYTAMERAILG